ncbi:hypothetical protein VSX64_13735 [Aurantimonas sp. C2-6-R+9]|uniref:hypothetical protein n=1 Tax=unclassified Aurantimonas TaxID=2638230 RepID=UPI002E18810E|nr:MULTISPECIES: hypothetical protein [unclassified Aurantimonas]MEC5291712.1 hypothetical protein [Aurantimonas sp. C2-3-R2]MEC5381931.1 hypothetical protein [Aurantimonas sp. C2-6-R+9]MEC5412834.1 hypothetical protein [Aurantimonas sp. C2-4-R8]
MPQWIVDLVGESLASIVWVAIVATAVCLLAILMIVLAKKAFGSRIGIGFKGSAPRLAVMDVARIDEKRRLVLVRRDEVEHLVLVGGQNDVLIEGSILRVRATTGARRDEPRGDFPEFEDDMSPEPASAQGVAPIPVPIPAPEAKPLAPRPEPRHQEAVASRTPSENKSRPAPMTAPLPVPPAPTVPPAPMAAGTEQAKAPAYSAAPIPEIDTDCSPASARSLPPRSIATPTLNLRQSRSTTDAGNVSSESPASKSDAALPASPASGRREPSLAVPDVQRDPMASKAEQPRADLRAQMNRAQSPTLERVQDATAPAIAVDAVDRRDPPRQPLSVRSFATAIQNRKAPPEMPQPAPKAAEATIPQDNANTSLAGPDQRDRQRSGPPAAGGSSTSSSQTEAAPKRPSVPDAEPSLEDFLSAEMDADFGNDAFFADKPDDGDPGADAPRGAPPVEASRSEPDPATATEAPRVVAPAPPASSTGGDTPPRSAVQPDTPPRTAAAPVPLTLEEEMERLLGDFNFGDDSDRKAN